MPKCHFSAMCVICTAVAAVSVSILVGLWTFQFVSPPKSTRSLDPDRLPDTLVPDWYDLTLYPRLSPNPDGIYVFTGSSSVTFRCLKDTDLILIHSNKLNLTAPPTLSALGGSPAPPVKSYLMKESTQYLIIHLEQNLKAGESYRLHTEFRGELADYLGGFYRSEYLENGVRRFGVTRSSNPRRIFPCFDEPNMKAVFNLTVLQDRGAPTICSHIKLEETKTSVDGDEVLITRFHQTEKISPRQLILMIRDCRNLQPSTSIIGSSETSTPNE